MPSSIARALVAGLVVVSASGCSSTFTERPYRFDVAAPAPSATELVGQRMGRDVDTTPALVDPSRGVVLSRWKIVGVSEGFRLWPPGEDRAWILERWRAVVAPYGWSSMVLFDVERVVCDKDGFGWDALNVWGRCVVDTQTTRDGQARVDATGAAVAARR